MSNPLIIERITANKAQCAKCKDIIESTWVHDFKSCKCGAIAVDGGKEYRRRIGQDGDIVELSEYTLYDYYTEKAVCPYCRTVIENEETYVDDHEECFPC